MTSSSLKIIFAGTPDVAATALRALIDSPHQIVAVYTQPDRPSGRGLKLTPGPVKELALASNLPVYQPTTLKDPEEQAKLAALQADIMVVAAYGMLLPAAVLAIPRLGCINSHFSLLPRWRGAAPMQRAVLAGDKLSGVTIMQLDPGLDTGPILLQHDYALAEDETSQTLHDKLSQMGAQSLLEALDLLAQGKLAPIPQDSTLATHAAKITKEEAVIDWSKPATQIECQVRGFNPWPIANTTWQDQHLRVWQAKAIQQDHHQPPGTILKASREGIDIATGSGILRLLQLQLPGGKVLSVGDFYNARQGDLTVGKLFS